MRATRLKAIAIIGCTLFSLGMASEVTYHATIFADHRTPEGQAEHLYLQALGDFPPSVVAELTDHFRHRFPPTQGVPITVLPPLPLPAQVADGHGILVTEEVILLLRRQNALVSANPRAVIIGLTTRDMYSREEGGVWAWRDFRYAVVSTAMFGAPVTGDSDAARLVRSRLRKMVAKNIAILYFARMHNNDPNSLLYARLRSVPQIDRAMETF
jgi:hypothetical protein